MDLGNYDMGGYKPGASLLKRVLWHFVNATVFHSWLLPWSYMKCALLRAFGATIGKVVVTKPRTNIKYGSIRISQRI